MTLDELLTEIAAFAAERSLEESFVSWKVFGHSKDLQRLRDGGRITLEKFEAAKANFAALRAPA